MLRIVIVALIGAINAVPAVAQQYWYYCDSAHAYYPYVSTCPEPWHKVVPTQGPVQASPQPKNKGAQMNTSRAFLALEQAAPDVSKIDSADVEEIMRRRFANPVSDVEPKLFGRLSICARLGLANGRRSPVDILQHECASDYLAWFSYCAIADADDECAALALMDVRTSSESDEPITHWSNQDTIDMENKFSLCVTDHPGDWGRACSGSTAAAFLQACEQENHSEDACMNVLKLDAIAISSAVLAR